MRGTKGRLRLTGGAFNEVFIAQGVYPEGKNHNIPWKAVPISKRIKINLKNLKITIMT